MGGGVWPKKTTIILHFGLGDLGCEINILPRCLQGRCRMIVTGTRYHARVLCSRSEGLKPGQVRVEGKQKSIIPKGLFVRLLDLHEKWLASKDDFSSWCTKCGEGGVGLLMCDSENCSRVQHQECPKLCSSDDQEWWLCDLCFPTPQALVQNLPTCPPSCQ